MRVDLADLQGNVLAGYNYPQAAHLFCRVDDAAAGRAWLRTLAPRVTNAEPWTSGKPDVTVNVALSCAGLAAVGVPPADILKLPKEFQAGMAGRAARLQDTGADDPTNWQPGLDDRTAHLLVTVHVRLTSKEAPRALDDALATLTRPAGVTVLATERTALLEGGREHFGFGDGLAQPDIDDDVAGPYNGLGTPSARRRGADGWAPVAPGEFVLGYPDEDGDVPAGPAPLDRNASFMVVRKLDQHVAAWERQLLRWAGGDAEHAEWLAAQVVGRWKNGTPVASSPSAPNPLLDQLPDALNREQRHDRFTFLNDFRFGRDPQGDRCPVGAHIRRANPRDAFGDGRLARRHRLIRRGMPYGTEATAAERLDDSRSPPRGLLFVCLQASIARQFELIQGDWLQDGDAFGLGTQKDTLMCAGAPEGRMLVGGSRSREAGGRAQLLTAHERTVTLRGGGYYVVPSISALGALGALGRRPVTPA